MSPSTLKRLGMALFGTAWQTELGRALGVSRAAIVGWSKGRFMPRPKSVEAARVLITQRIAELKSLRQQLR